MGLRLKDAFFKVRSLLGELNQSYWSDQQIIMDLNTAARDMCSTAQTLTQEQDIALEQTTLEGTQTGLQEAALIVDIDEIKSCKYFSGQLYDLEYHDWDTLQLGASTGSIPLYFYIKTDTRQLTPQSTATSQILNIPIASDQLGDQYRQVIGVWPIPPEPATLSVWYSYLHRWMATPTDPCALPYQFLDGWVAYGVGQSLLIEKAYDEAATWMATYEKRKEAYRVFATRGRQGTKAASYGTQVPPWRRDASSSVIILSPTGGV
jgi:hypothetical protein